jgi:hypothetical protein
MKMRYFRYKAGERFGEDHHGRYIFQEKEEGKKMGPRFDRYNR